MQDEQDDRLPFRPDTVTYWVVLLSNAMRKKMEAVIAPLDVSTLQFSILDMASRGFADTVTSMARVIPSDASAISRNVEQLRSRGLLADLPQEGDRRVVRLALTDEGSELLNRLVELVVAEESQMVASITDEERKTLENVARKLLAGLVQWPSAIGSPDPGRE